MITVDVRGVDHVRERLGKVPERVQAGLLSRMRSLAEDLRAVVVGQKLGGEVLRSHSGRLQSSIFTAIDQTANGVTATVGSAAPYAAFLEQGFSGAESVQAHLRTITEAFGRPIKAGAREFLVHAYTREVDFPAHSFLGIALRDNADRIRSGMAQAVDQAVNEAMS